MAGKASVSCGEFLDIQHAEELKQRFLDALDKCADTYIINAQKVTKVDSAGIQIILGFFKRVEQQGATIAWKQPSEDFIQAATLLGVNKPLNLEQYVGVK